MSTIKQARSRRAASAYLEALIVAGLFTVLLAWVTSFGRAALQRVHEAHAAREAAWAGADEPCDDQRAAVWQAAHALVTSPDAERAHRLIQSLQLLEPGASASPDLERWSGASALPNMSCNEAGLGWPDEAPELGRLLEGAQP